MYTTAQGNSGPTGGEYIGVPVLVLMKVRVYLRPIHLPNGQFFQHQSEEQRLNMKLDTYCQYIIARSHTSTSRTNRKQ